MICPLASTGTGGLLIEFVSGALEARAASEIEQHLAGCEACSGFVRSQRLLWRELDGWQAEPVTADFDRRLYARIDSEAGWWHQLRMSFFRPLWVRRGVPIAAAAGLLVVAGVVLERMAVPSTPRGGNSAQVQSLEAEQVEHALDEMETLSQFNRLMKPDSAEPRM